MKLPRGHWLKQIKGWLRGKGVRSPIRSVRPRLEELEKRLVPAPVVYTVNTDADNNAYNTDTHSGSLRAVINALNTGGDNTTSNTINFNSTYDIVLKAGQGFGALPQIKKPVQINGNYSIIDGSLIGKAQGPQIGLQFVAGSSQSHLTNSTVGLP